MSFRKKTISPSEVNRSVNSISDLKLFFHPYRVLAVVWLLLGICLPTVAQIPLSGTVLDAAGHPLPFVNIVVNQDTRLGTTTDIDGRFQLPAAPPVRQLHFSFVGYEDLYLSLDTIDTKPPWRIRMQETAYEFAAVEVVAGVNPADLIMQKVIRNRHRNNPEKLDSYRCRTYNKVVMSWLPRTDNFREKISEENEEADSVTLNRQQANLLKLMESADEHHLFLMESLTERRYRSPAAYAETILANRVSGLQEAPFTALANDVQPFSFYDEQVMLLDKAFLNPISPGSPQRYFFHLEDTLYRQTDTIYLITFHPRQHKNFNGLKGVLYVNTHRYGLQNIIAEPADTGLIHFRIEQLYDRPDTLHWFPAQLNYEIRMPKYPSPDLGLQIRGKSYIREAEMNPDLDRQAFKQNDRYVFTDSAFQVADETWIQHRPQPLDTLETRTYELVDSLGAEHNFDGWMQRLEALGRGRWPLGWLDLSLPKLVQFNQYENIRLGLGLYTGENLASWFTLGGYAGYGLRDRAWKYGGEIRFFPDWDRRWEWQWYYQQDIREAGAMDFPLLSDFISRRLYAGRMDREERYGTFLRIQSLRYLQVGLEVSRSVLEPLYDYAFRPTPESEPDREYDLPEAAIHLHYAYGQQYRRLFGNRVPDGSEHAYPALSLSVKRGFGSLWKGEYPYWQVRLAIDQRFRLLYLGKTIYRLEGGVTDGAVPVSRLYNSAGSGREFQWLTVGNTFQTMDPYEFLSDRYVSFFFRQEFGTLLFKTKWLQPSISLEHHFTVGTLSDPDRHEGITFNTLEKGYAEAGLVLDNIIRLNYVNFAYLGFGGGVYYRYGAYHLPGGVGENLAFRLSVAFDF
ncbi:DUF5686 and carboxypeptidase-like regulatory domain-containing protein [Flavilitoribacter nigricans]|uniref:DUF5686 and carboxypeptidase-like regulatory domain-containing protein n=1 Tax=Flavilitoribacter nigricans TaxID=70997 RepID=UPI001628EC01|nr:DUF5686 and carboxypeptidase-like regulatory domain-containing protein [Flavilitoribacter nigricans]